MRRAGLAGAALVGAACAHAPPPPTDVPRARLRAPGLETADDPTVRGARLFPERWDGAHGWGVEQDGGSRGIVAGLRVVARPDGSMSVANDRFTGTPASVTSLPGRLGGGFLFAIGGHVWRADTWLGPARSLFSWSLPIAQILVGLDRVYLRSTQGALVALDAATGAALGLGPLPASPSIGRLEALDAWRAVAIADLRGVLMTVDAGSSWQPVVLPIDPSDVVALGDSIAVGGVDEGHQMQWWEVRSDGQTARLAVGLGTAARGDPRTSGVHGEHVSAATDGREDGAAWAARALGPRPLVAAIEDGWPMGDGTALVARDGALARIGLAEGSVPEVVAGAFPLQPARCHAIALGFDRASAKTPDPSPPQGPPETQKPGPASMSPSVAGDIAFACGEPRGRTVLYRWDPPNARLVELRRFDTPRAVLGFGNGALAVRGACDASTPEEAPFPRGAEQGPLVWCTASPNGAWRDVQVPAGARLVVLADGRVAWVQPPTAGDLTTAQLVIARSGVTAETPIAFPSLPADAARAIASGVWLDGFEERRPGVVGGWIDAAGAMVGIEIATGGQARVGEYIRDAGAPVASGRWAFGWSASRSGFESTDGGMTWSKELAMPDVIASGRGVRERVCGPVGCIAAGWLRVGWGPTERPLVPEPLPVSSRPDQAAPGLDLDCAPTGGRAPAPPTSARTSERSDPPGPRPRPSAQRALSTALYAGTTWGAATELPPLGAWRGPAMPADNVGLSVEMHGALEPRLHVPLGRVYAWGPDSGEWDQLGRWQVKWQWAWGGWQDVRATTTAASPWGTLDGARRDLGMGPGLPTAWTVVDADDPDHALLLVRRSLAPPSAEVVVVEADRPAVQVQRPSGDPFAEVESAARVGGRWYLVTMQSSGETAASVLWSIEGSVAREVLRVPRAGFETRRPLRLARSMDGRALGLVVDGQLAGSGGASRWVAAVDLEAGTVATPEFLAPADFSDRAVLPCSGDEPGWEFDVPYPGLVRVRSGAHWETPLQSPVARLRVSRERACIERLLGSSDAYATSAPEALTDLRTPSAAGERENLRSVPVSVLSAKMRYSLRCWPRR